jgi:hypothetical protein
MLPFASRSLPRNARGRRFVHRDGEELEQPDTVRARLAATKGRGAMAKKKMSRQPRSRVSEKEALQAVATIRRYLDKETTPTRADYREAVLANRTISRHITGMAKVQRERERARTPRTKPEKMLKKMLAELKMK